MWKFVILGCFVVSWTTAQNKGSQRPFDNGHGWDIRLAVPGEPGNDYPTLNSIPRTSFTCSGKEPGYYADVETNCQAFRVCTYGSTYGFQSFLCPNGTLFNQAVFVCDWWMKVNCKKSPDFFRVNNDKFVKLKLGSQFMTDIKKMISHPMRSPYDDIYTKSKLIVMQEYKPPPNQLYNGASLSKSNRSPNNEYFQTKQVQRNSLQDLYLTAGMSYAASTPSTQYFPNFNIFQTTSNKNAQFIQKHKLTKPYVLLNRTGNSKNIRNDFSLHSHSGQTAKAKSLDIISYSENTQSIRPTQVYQRSIQSTQTTKPQERVKENVESVYTRERQIHRNHPINKSKQIEFLKQQLHRNVNYDKLLNSNKKNQALYSKNTIGNETKQNLVSSDTSSAIIAKTLAFRRIIKDSTNGNPKSRITFKTWIVRPSKNSKLIVEPSHNTYRKPTFFEKIIADIPDDNTLNISTPTKETETNDDAYVYNIPTIKLSDQVLTTSEETINLLSSSTTPPEILTSYPVPTSSPTMPSSLYLVPTTFKPSAPLYIPPTEKQISRQYLSPIIENSKFIAAASSPRPFLAINKSEPSYFLSKQTHVNTNHNNLAFSDILTKEKLDITVNDIVKDTNNVLETASSEEFQHFKQDIQSIDYPRDNFLYSDSDTQSDEKLILKPPPPLPKSSRLIVAPSINLEPPIEPFDNINRNTNGISNLPYFEESTRRPSTIERTVSLKITIPENIASLLFRNTNTSNSESKLEILNTGNSNNWVMVNGDDSIPIGKLTWNKNSNISDSQDLVFSFLVDSINTAKDYSNIVHQNIASPPRPTPTQPQFQNVKNEELQRISNDISQLTSSQFSAINSSTNYRIANQKISPPSDLNSLKTYANTNSINGFSKNQHIQVEQQSLTPSQQKNQKQIEPKTYSASENDDFTNLDINSDKIYSGQLYQLPVPVVTKQIYNSLHPTNIKLSSNIIQTKHPIKNNINANFINDKIVNHSNNDFNIIQSDSINPNTLPSVTNPPEVIKNQRIATNAFIDTLELPKNGITAQLQDNIVGTLPHPLDEDKLIKYKKDQTYYIYTHLNNDDELSTENQINNIQNIIGNNLANRIFSQNDRLSQSSTFQLIPSLSYKLEDEKEKQKVLNAFQLNEYGIPKQILPYQKENLIRRQDVASDVDFTVDHSKINKVDKPVFLNALYDGPNSYSAPQRSVGNLIETQGNVQSISNFNSKIEKFDTDEDKNIGYPKIIPAKRFVF